LGGGNNSTASARQPQRAEEDEQEEEEDDGDSLDLLGEEGEDEDAIIIEGVDDDDDDDDDNLRNDDEDSDDEEVEDVRAAVAAIRNAAAAALASGANDDVDRPVSSSSSSSSSSFSTFAPSTSSSSSTTQPLTATTTTLNGGSSSSSSSSSKPAQLMTEKALAQLDDSSSFDGFEGFRGRRVSYSSQPKARHNIVFEIWRQRTPEDVAILYKGQHQYSASRRVQEAINEQVSTLLGMSFFSFNSFLASPSSSPSPLPPSLPPFLPPSLPPPGMFLREPDFQSRLQIQGGQLANLFFKLQLLGYMFSNADKVLSASSSLNLDLKNQGERGGSGGGGGGRRPPPPPVGELEGSVTVLQGRGNVLGSGEGGGEGGRNVTMGAKELLGSLVREVEVLREEVERAKMTREVSRQSDLIAFIRALPEEQQRALTENTPDYTLDCMRKLVDLALARAIPTVGNQWNPVTPVLIPSKGIFAELCIMQVVQGYLLAATEEDQAQQLKLFGGGTGGAGGGNGGGVFP